MNKLSKIKYQALLARCAVFVQKIYRGTVGRRSLLVQRNLLANIRLDEGRIRAKHEINACIIQRIFRGWKDRKYCILLVENKRKLIEAQAYKERMIRLIIRIARGKLGRIKTKNRRIEIKWIQHLWSSALLIIRKFNIFLFL
jgi:hypothetical protein